MKVTDLTENEVIHCPTKEEYDAICKLLHEAGLRWKSGQTYLEFSVWNGNRQKFCLCPKNGSWAWFDICEEYGCTIYPASDFLTPVQTKEEYAKQKAMEFDAWKVKNNVKYNARGKWYYDNKDNMFDRDYFTTSELYDEFEKQLKIKE